MKREKVKIRRYTMSDLDRLCEMFIDTSILSSLSAQLSVKSLSRKKEKDRLKETLKKYGGRKPKSLDQVIEAEGEYVGGIGIHNVDWENKKAEIGYWIGKDYWGKGYAKEAVKQTIKLLFGKYKFVRISALTFSDNIPSQRVLENSGFEYEGTLRKNAKRNNKFVDDKMYAILRK